MKQSDSEAVESGAVGQWDPLTVRWCGMGGKGGGGEGRNAFFYVYLYLIFTFHHFMQISYLAILYILYMLSWSSTTI